MKFIWDFFEEFDEMVYVSDMETNSLVYMNARLRNSLGYSSHNEYIGEKCYKVLQGLDEPCPFCTNKDLKGNEFISWTHQNPVMDKRFLVKDRMITHDSKKYRVEIAIDMDSEVICDNTHYYARSETILHECLRKMVSTMNVEESIEQIFAYIGTKFLCDRVYIFELHDENLMSNTYEWCAEGVVHQKEILQKESTESVDWWLQKFNQNEIVLIEDLEDIKAEHPISYTLLKPQNISTLAVAPIYINNKVCGFFGVDNPKRDMFSLIKPLLTVMGYFIPSLLRRRDLLNRLNNLSFHDSLTGAFNRNAMAEHHVHDLQMDSVGVIYCDITGLKRTNDTMGHEAGDRMIQDCYNLIHEELKTEWIYRTGGDEFVAVHPNCNKEDFYKTVETLHQRIQNNKHHIAVGYVWSDEQPLNLEVLISKADKIMYQDKRDYYDQNYMVHGVDRRQSSDSSQNEVKKSDSLFSQFWTTTYHDMEALFQSISEQNTTSYFYFGDMQKNLFYISDNMRDEFGFDSNIVPNLPQVWLKNIIIPQFKELYMQEFKNIMEEKRNVHDLRYQVCNVNGKNIWIRCYGIVKWDEEKKIPLFFSGRITHQDNNFVVDPITNFPREAVVLKRLNELKESNQKSVIIGFSLKNITELNNTRGRGCVDRLLKNVADKLVEKLSDKMSFYRLEGIRCLALINPEYSEHAEKFIAQIREIISSCYRAMSISIHHTCSFVLMEYPYPPLTPEEFMENMVSLIRVAKRKPTQAYLRYSPSSLYQIKEMSNMALTLNENVLHEMENFRIVVQPVVSSEDGKIKGGEVLLRWKFQGKDISPTIFVPILEKGDMINIVGRWVFEQAVRTCIRIIPYIPNFYISFNVSLRQLNDTGLNPFMRDIMNKYHIDGSHLVAEMTESCLDEQPEQLSHFVEECSEMGIRIALDDFGSGYSSLRMLLQYPSNIIKLDRSLLHEITDSDKKQYFIRSIVYACHQFGKQVCIEGVETEEENNIIKDTGCDMIQGYYYHKPMELNTLYGLLSEM